MGFGIVESMRGPGGKEQHVAVSVNSTKYYKHAIQMHELRGDQC